MLGAGSQPRHQTASDVDIGVSQAVEVEFAFKCIVLLYKPAYSWAPLPASFKAGAVMLYLFVTTFKSNLFLCAEFYADELI